MSRKISYAILLLALSGMMAEPVFAQRGHGRGGGGFRGGSGFRGGGGGGFRGGNFSAPRSGGFRSAAPSIRSPAMRAPSLGNRLPSRSIPNSVGRPSLGARPAWNGSARPNISGLPRTPGRSAIGGLGQAGNRQFGNLRNSGQNRPNWGQAGVNRPPLQSGVRAPWADRSPGRGPNSGSVTALRPGLNNGFRYNQGFNNNWNNWARNRAYYGYGANRYGWNWNNNSWVNNNYWNRGYGYRWNRGYWPWWGALGLGYWPGWALRGYGYGGYGYGGYVYANPYYTTGMTNLGYYDYSQPLPAAPVVDNSVAVADASTPDQTTADAAMASFDAARQSFRAGNYAAALQQVDAALKLVDSDSSLHEFRALVLFAQQQYDAAAATIYPVLAAGPGWDWPTLRSMYDQKETYTQQLRNLENFTKSHPESASSRFLLAYHYLSMGHMEHAVKTLEKVVQLQPEDHLAKSLLDVLTGKAHDVKNPTVPSVDVTP